MSQLNDISLVAQVVVFKNTRAFDQLVQKYQSPVRRFFLHLTCGDSELSDDLAQDTFIKAYTNLASFRNLSSFSTWLYRIAYNIFYDYIRSRKEMADLDTREVDAVNCTEQANIGQTMDVYQSLKSLKEVERTCITLFYMEDVSIDKIAGITGIPAGTEPRTGMVVGFIFDSDLSSIKSERRIPKYLAKASTLSIRGSLVPLHQVETADLLKPRSLMRSTCVLLFKLMYFLKLEEKIFLYSSSLIGNHILSLQRE